MPQTNLLPWNCAAIVASIAAIVTGIRMDLPMFAWCGAVLFAAVLVAAAIDINLPWWDRDAEPSPELAAHAAVRNARLIVLGYAWGSLALLAIYRLTSLRWQHGLQYGAGMALIAWLMLLYIHFLARPGSRLRTPRALIQATWMSLAHGGAALGGVIFLLASGKVHSIKDDWAANTIFLVGGITVAALSAVAAYTQFRLAARHAGGMIGGQ